MSGSAGRMGGAGWTMTRWSAAATLLLAPAVAMRFTPEVRWDAADFLLWAAMLGGTGLAFELIVRRTANGPYRAGMAVALAAAFLLVWVDLAVGVVGTESDPANLLFAALLVLAPLGAAVVRLRSAGMARVLAATAAGQAGIGVAALAGGLGREGAGSPWDVAGATALFVGLWCVSAALFAAAAARRPAAVRRL